MSHIKQEPANDRSGTHRIAAAGIGFGQDFVLGLHLLLQELNPLLLLIHLAAGTLPSLKGSCSVFEELLLPAVEHRRAAGPVLHTGPRRAPCPKGAASKWPPSLLRCN